MGRVATRNRRHKNLSLSLNKPNMSNIERQYRDILESLNLTQHITKPTRVTPLFKEGKHVTVMKKLIKLVALCER